jgi:hypothetical protein
MANKVLYVHEISGGRVWQRLEPNEVMAFSNRQTRATFLYVGVKATEFRPNVTGNTKRMVLQGKKWVMWEYDGEFTLPNLDLVEYDVEERKQKWIDAQERAERRKQRQFKLKDLRYQQRRELADLHSALERMDAQSTLEEDQRQMRYLTHAERAKINAKTLAAAFKAMGFSLESIGDMLNVPGFRFWEDESSRERDHEVGRKTGVEAIDEN